MLVITLQNDAIHLQQSFSETRVFVGSDDHHIAGISEVESPIVESALFQLDVGMKPAIMVECEGNSKPIQRIKVTNYGESIALAGGTRVHRGKSTTLELPVSFRINKSHVQIYDSTVPQEIDSAIDALPGHHEVTESKRMKKLASPEPTTLAAWFKALSELQQVVAGSQRLFELAAQSLFNPGGLDGGIVLMPTSDGWRVESSYVPYPDQGILFREDLVEQAVTNRKTIYHDVSQLSQDLGADLHSAVVCPVFGSDDQVVAVLYGFRSPHGRNQRRGIRVLEAQFAQVVSDSISAGLIRLESEAKETRSRILLEQVFSPSVAAKLHTHPEILDGQQKEVTVLFADLRKFTAISEALGTHDTYELLTDVMDRFGKIITDLDGVIIDFYGDGVSAFWNAPVEQPDHATRACKAGQRIVDCLPDVNREWRELIEHELMVGVGIHTGIARVGNSGSRSRLKYGPRGLVVNIASRLENATKSFGLPMVVSAETARAAQETFNFRKIATTQLNGVTMPVDACEVFTFDRTPGKHQLQRYGQALAAYEYKKFDVAKAILGELSLQYPKDKAVVYLWKLVERELRIGPGVIRERNNLESVEESTEIQPKDA